MQITGSTQSRCLATFCWLLLVGAVAAPLSAAPTASQTTTNSPWQRIVLIGASATAGFTVTEPLGGTNTPLYGLSRYVEAALTVPHEPVKNLGNAYLFLQPQMFAQLQLTQALTNQPTLVLGVDFLFWFCYGEGSTDAERLERFEHGLKLLEKIECPLVVGDLPDASATVNVMLRPDQMPSLQAIAAANLRLKAWAANRSQVIVLGLSEFMRNAVANRAISVHDYVLPDGATRQLLQDDKLHASPAGCAVLAFALLDAVSTTRTGIHLDEFRRDPKEILRRVLEAAKATPARTTRTNNPPAEIKRSLSGHDLPAGASGIFAALLESAAPLQWARCPKHWSLTKSI